jgi:Putative MetA-pathway of phenol degradation
MSARRAGPRLAVHLVMMWFVLGPATSPAGGQDTPADNIPLSATFVTEGVLPATEIEAEFSFVSSDEQREYQFGLSSLQYAWGTTFGLKLVVPFAVIEPRDDGPTVAGPGDVQLLAKYTPLVSREHLFALGAAVKLTLPSGSEARGLGGTLALAPGLLAGKAWRLGDTILSLQADAFYSWQLDTPAPIETESGSSSPDREQRLTANLTTALAPIRWLTGIVEVNTVTVIAGDPERRGRFQMYLTPGVSLEPVPSWSVRVGVQVPLTRARELDYNVIFLATKGF